MSNEFKYLLFPDKTYVLTFQDYDGNDFSVDILGADILSQIRRGYALDNFIDKLDKDADE